MADKVMPEDVQKALSRLLGYNWQAECKDAQEQDDLEGHIFLDMVALDNWLYDNRNTPEDFLMSCDSI